MQSSLNEVGGELAPAEDADWSSMGPSDLAKYPCEKAKLTPEQQGPVALVARDMQIAYDEELARRAALPMKGRRLCLLLYGGGGCGKTRIINYGQALSAFLWRQETCTHCLLHESIATH